MSEGIFGKNADLAQRLKDRIAFHANEHRHTYEIGKGVMDALALDLLADFRDAGGVILPVKPNGTVWLIRRRRVVSATVMFVGAGADGTTMKSLGIDTSGEYPRFYYPPDMVDQAIADIVKGVTEKRGRYHDYGKALETARARTKGERGFWEQARLVKGGEDHDVP